jgi:hypothetical protein
MACPSSRLAICQIGPRIDKRLPQDHHRRKTTFELRSRHGLGIRNDPNLKNISYYVVVPWEVVLAETSLAFGAAYQAKKITILLIGSQFRGMWILPKKQQENAGFCFQSISRVRCSPKTSSRGAWATSLAYNKD